jgi:hypothetical protein
MELAAEAGKAGTAIRGAPEAAAPLRMGMAWAPAKTGWAASR